MCVCVLALSRWVFEVDDGRERDWGGRTINKSKQWYNLLENEGIVPVAREGDEGEGGEE